MSLNINDIQEPSNQSPKVTIKMIEKALIKTLVRVKNKKKLKKMNKKVKEYCNKRLLDMALNFYYKY